MVMGRISSVPGDCYAEAISNIAAGSSQEGKGSISMAEASDLLDRHGSEVAPNGHDGQNFRFRRRDGLPRVSFR
jgi:hypothetical protein